MKNNIVPKIIPIKPIATVTNTPVQSAFFELNNYQYADMILLFEGGGEEVATHLKVVIQNEEGETIPIPYIGRNNEGIAFYNIDSEGADIYIGGENSDSSLAVIRITAEELLKYNTDKVAIELSPVESRAITLCIIAIGYAPRYTEGEISDD